MIISILSIVVSFIFLSLGVIHFYWAFGGEWAMKEAVPTKEENENSGFKPPAFATLFVGLTLVISACLYFIKANLIAVDLPKWTNFILWILPTLFLLRAIGEFNYVGFFKKVKNTGFAKWDSKLYSPLCLIISLFCFIISYLS